jgi:hypothetical protein
MSVKDTYVNITNPREWHYEVQCKNELNILDKPHEETASSCADLFYFTKLEYVHHFYTSGCCLRIVNIPDDAQVVEDSNETSVKKWSTNKLVLCEKYPLFNIRTVSRFGLKITCNYILEACKNEPDTDKEWVVHIMSIYMDESEIKELLNQASFTCNMTALNCFMKSYKYWLCHKYKKWHLSEHIKQALHWATLAGHINVLEWLKLFGFPLKVPEEALKYASENGQTEVVEWWTMNNPNKIYVKITNKDECHYGFSYKDGLNIIDDKNMSTGLHYTDLENVHHFYGNGIWLRIVKIPYDAQVVSYPNDTQDGVKWSTNKLVLCDKYPLSDLDTLKRFNIKITPEYIRWASANCHIDVLQKLKDIGEIQENVEEENKEHIAKNIERS